MLSKVLLAAVSLVSCAHAFMPAISTGASHASRVPALRAEGKKINYKIELDSPKVATMDKLAPGGKAVYCRCWLSEKFPMCDGAHVKHNEENGDNIGPLIVSVDK